MYSRNYRTSVCFWNIRYNTISDSFFQNTKDITEFSQRIASLHVAPQVGYVLSKSELITAAVIEYILCNEGIHWNDIASITGESEDSLKNTFASHLKSCKQFEIDGLLVFTQSGFTLRLSVNLRNIVAVFDTKFATSVKHFQKQFNMQNKTVAIIGGGLTDLALLIFK